MNYLVEIKTEYTIRLTNILSIKINEGINAIYEEAVKSAKPKEELKVFQGFLKQVPSWPTTLLENEVKRIYETTECGPSILKQLVDAVIKANIMILSNSQEIENDVLIDFKDFIHNCYIETARNIYINPYLYYNKCSYYEKKQNERETIKLIKASIIEAIRKMLPLQIILKKYLGSNINNNKPDVNNILSEAECDNLNNMLKKDLTNNLSPTKSDKKISPDNKSTEKRKSSIKKNDSTEKRKSSIKKNSPHKSPVNISEKPQNLPIVPEIEENNDSVSYYRKGNIQDTFSNSKSTNPKNIFIAAASEKIVDLPPPKSDKKFLITDSNDHIENLY